MIARPCTGCGDVIATGSRCGACRPTSTRKPNDHVHSNTARWKAFSKRLRRESPFCEWCGSTERLQLDHVIPVAVADELAYSPENCRVLCKVCNGRRQATYTAAEATEVLTRLQDSYRRRPTRTGRERIAAAERALADVGDSPSDQRVPSAGKPQSAIHTLGGIG